MPENKDIRKTKIKLQEAIETTSAHAAPQDQHEPAYTNTERQKNRKQMVASAAVYLSERQFESHTWQPKQCYQNQHRKANPAHILAHTMRYIPCRITEDVSKCCSRRRREKTVDEDEDSRHRNSEYVTRGRDMKRENTHAQTNAP